MTSHGNRANLEPAWIDLPCHALLFEAAFDWFSRGPAAGELTIQGAAGTGKTLFIKEFAARQAANHARLVLAEFSTGERPTLSHVYSKWSRTLEQFVEPSRSLDHHAWVDLAIRSMRQEGYRVILAVEADHTSVAGLPYEHVIRLDRRPFHGFIQGKLILPPWSHDELALALAANWPELMWPEEVIEELWISSTGHAQPAMGLARRLADQSKALNHHVVELSGVEKNLAIHGIRADWSGHFKPF